MAEFLYLTTVGRRSSSPREIEIWFTCAGGRYHVIAEHGHQAHWVQNIVANADVRVRLGEARFAAAARVIDPAAEPGLLAAVQARSRAKYGWGDGLVVELNPLPSGA